MVKMMIEYAGVETKKELFCLMTDRDVCGVSGTVPDLGRHLGPRN